MVPLTNGLQLGSALKWYTPCREQAGAQEKRGCIEHIVTLRLIIDRCTRLKAPLFVAFVDFSKAYDRVPRKYLINLLRALGCGRVMLTALASMYWLTELILGSTVIAATLGVKQGSPTSCFLFILFVDELIKLLKLNSPMEGFLKWLHLLMLMDDTVILATSYEKLQLKLDILVQWCDRSGMVINEDKTKFMAFSSPSERKRPIFLLPASGRVIVKHCSKYVYLGSVITSDGKVKTSVAQHTKYRVHAMNKLIRFLDKNKNAPYVVKKKVVDACFNASILYGCESWLGEKPCRDINNMYMKGIKLLLGVRTPTNNDICLIEAGYPSLEAVIRSRQKKFLETKINERAAIPGDPLMYALSLTHEENPSTSRYITELLSHQGNLLQTDINQRKTRIRTSERSKIITYRCINPTLETHSIYKVNLKLDDYLRTDFTRFRLSSHRLLIETGRWLRLPREARICQCGENVQTEEHALTECTIVEPIRQKYGYKNINFHSFMSNEKSKTDLIMLHTILKTLEKS